MVWRKKGRKKVFGVVNGSLAWVMAGQWRLSLLCLEWSLPFLSLLSLLLSLLSLLLSLLSRLELHLGLLWLLLDLWLQGEGQ